MGLEEEGSSTISTPQRTLVHVENEPDVTPPYGPEANIPYKKSGNEMTDVEGVISIQPGASVTPDMVELPKYSQAMGGTDTDARKKPCDTEKGEHSTKVDEKEAPDTLGEEYQYPDGGWRAWSVVFGGSCVTFSTFGFVNAWGAFQAYYENVKFPDHSPSSIAWIGSIQYSLIFVPGIIVGRLFDRGYFRAPFVFANLLLLLATFLIPECKQFYQTLLCQGILTGVASGMMFSPILAVVSHWFKARRQLAFGLLAVGSSIGGTVFPLIVRATLPAVGFKWTMRILGFVILATTSIAQLLLKPRLPPRKTRGRVIDISQFKNVAFSIYTAASVIGFLGIYTMLTYVATYATQRNVSQSMAYNLVAIANAASLIGRLTTGLLADKYGPLNIMTPFTFSAAIFTYVWPLTRTMSSILPLTVLYGICSGAFVALVGSPVVSMGSADSVGERTGLLFSMTAIGALSGPPISGAIRGLSNSTDAGRAWRPVGIYAGTMVLVAVGLMCLTRRMVIGRWGKGVI